MAQKIPLSQRFKDRAVRQFIEQAANEDWDFSKFWTKASSMGVNDQPQVQNYATILKEKQTRQRSQKRDQEVSGLMRQATRDRGAVAPPPEQQPMEGAQQYTGMEEDPWGDTPQAPPQAPPPPQEPLTRRRVYEDVARLSQEQGVAQPTVELAEKYGLNLYQTEEDLQNQEKALKKEAFEKQKQDDLNKHRKRMLARGYKDDAIDEVQKKLDYVSDEKKRTSMGISKLEGQKKQYMGLKQMLEKSIKSGASEIDMDAMAALDGAGIDSGLALTDPASAIAELDAIIMQKSAEVKAAQKESNDIDRSYAELLEDPQAKLTDILKSGRESTLAGEGMTRPRALGGPAQIQARQQPSQGPVKISTPQDYYSLPSGAEYIDPQGNRRRKP
jgi:hypothetical protein